MTDGGDRDGSGGAGASSDGARRGNRTFVHGFDAEASPEFRERDERSLGQLATGPEEPGGVGKRLAGLPARTVVSAVALLALAALFCYDAFVVHVYLVPAWEWDPTRSDWLFLASLWLLGTLASRLVPNRELAARYWHRLSEDTGATLALAALAAFFLVGVVGPPLVGSPSADPLLGGQPPVGLSVDTDGIASCAGQVTGDRCQGSLAHPLGTDGLGFDVLTLLVAGTRLALYVAVISAAIVVPLGAIVGATAGFYGGRIDAVLSRYVDVQQTIPAIVAYVVLVLVVEKSLFMLVLVFGLFSWGGVARVVRAETRQRRDEEYVRAAQALGGAPGYRLRRHVLPNVSHGIVTAFGQQVPLLLVTEAAIAYLQLNDVDQPSWGELIATGIQFGVTSQWWVATSGVVALAGTTLAFKLAADALRDALDPTG